MNLNFSLTKKSHTTMNTHRGVLHPLRVWVALLMGTVLVLVGGFLYASLLFFEAGRIHETLPPETERPPVAFDRERVRAIVERYEERERALSTLLSQRREVVSTTTEAVVSTTTVAESAVVEVE